MRPPRRSGFSLLALVAGNALDNTLQSTVCICCFHFPPRHLIFNSTDGVCYFSDALFTCYSVLKILNRGH